MSPERARLPKGARKRIRVMKSHLRHEFGLTHPSADSILWTKVEEILKLRLGDQYTPHTRILRDFFDLRIGIKEGKPLTEVAKFQDKYNDPKLFQELKPAFEIIRDIVGK